MPQIRVPAPGDGFPAADRPPPVVDLERIADPIAVAGQGRLPVAGEPFDKIRD
jgi:hypothetical protein